MKLEIFTERLTNTGVDDAAHLGVTKLGFGLAFKFWIGNLDRQHRCQALTDVFTGQVPVAVFALAALAGKGVEGAGENGFEAFNVSAAINGADVVGKAKDAVGIGINTPLQGGFHLNAVFLRIDVNDVGMKGILLRIHVVDVLTNAAFVEVGLFVGLAILASSFGALVAEDDLDPTIEVGQLPQTPREGGVIKADPARENLNVGLEANRGAGAAFLASFRSQTADGSTALKALTVHLVLTVNGDLHPFTQGIDHRNADAMQATGNLVTAGAELAAGVQHGEHGLKSALAGAGVHIGGDAASVIGHAAGPIGPEADINGVAVPGQGFIHRVIHHLVNEMVQTAGPCTADVHARAFPHRFKTLQNLDLLGAVGGLNLRGRGTGGFAHADNRRIALCRSKGLPDTSDDISDYHRLPWAVLELSPGEFRQGMQ